VLGGQAGKLRQYHRTTEGNACSWLQGASVFRLRKTEALMSTTCGGARVLEASATCMHACSRRRGRCSRCSGWVRTLTPTNPHPNPHPQPSPQPSPQTTLTPNNPHPNPHLVLYGAADGRG
jgi:hypothetical protein